MKLSTLAACGAVLFASVIWQAPAIAATQQDKMTTCNAAASAKNLTGDARKAFMSNCLSAHPAEAAPPMTQQEKMTACNKTASARNLAGDARKSFMSECLKAH
jgi:hypothetical protein